MAAVNAWPFISTQYGEMVVACLFYTPFNRGGESFLCAFPAFVLTTTKKKNNRWIKSFNYPCEERADTECVCVCDTIPPTPYEGREVVAMVAAIGAWRKWEGEAGSKQ